MDSRGGSSSFSIPFLSNLTSLINRQSSGTWLKAFSLHGKDVPAGCECVSCSGQRGTAELGCEMKEVLRFRIILLQALQARSAAGELLGGLGSWGKVNLGRDANA